MKEQLNENIVSRTGVVRVIEKLKKRANKKRVISTPLKECEKIDYKKVDTLKKFLTSYSKIKPRRATNLSRKQQSKLARAVKRARMRGFLPYITINEN